MSKLAIACGTLFWTGIGAGVGILGAAVFEKFGYPAWIGAIGAAIAAGICGFVAALASWDG